MPTASTYTYKFGDGNGNVVDLGQFNNEQDLKKAYVSWLTANNRDRAGETLGGMGPAMTDDEYKLISAYNRRVLSPQEVQAAQAMGLTDAQSRLHRDYIPLNQLSDAERAQKLGPSPYEGMTTSNTGAPAYMGSNQANYGAPNESGKTIPQLATSTPQSAAAYQSQLAAMQSGAGSSTPAPQPRQFTAPTYSGGTSGGGSYGGGSAPAAYRPGTYSGPQANTNVQYNGPAYQISPYQAPNYEPVNLDQYFQQYSQYLTPSEQETGIKQTINDLMASYRAGLTNIEGQPIAMQFVTGQSAAIDRQAEMEKANLLDALGLAQGNRLAMGDVARAQYEFANAEAIRRQNASENAFNQWSTTQQLQMANARQAFDQWAAEQGLSQSAANQAFNQWATQQGLNMQASGQAYDQWLGSQQLAQGASQQQFNQWLQQQQLALQAQGMTADEAYRATQLQLQRDQMAQQNNQFNAGLAAEQQAANTMTPYQQATLAQNQSQFNAQHTLQQQQEVARLQQQLADMNKPAYTEVNPGNTLYNTTTGQPIYTAPTTSQQNGGAGTGGVAPVDSTDALIRDFLSRDTRTATPPRTNAQTGTIDWSAYRNAPVNYQGTSVVDYLNQAGLPSDYNSRAALAAQMGITNYTGTAEQNTRLLAALQAGRRTYA